MSLHKDWQKDAEASSSRSRASRISSFQIRSQKRHVGKPLHVTLSCVMSFFFWVACRDSAGQKEEDQAGDQDPGEPARGDQHHPTGGHSQRPGGRWPQEISALWEWNNKQDVTNTGGSCKPSISVPAVSCRVMGTNGVFSRILEKNVGRY